jgi:hypothetical protein
MGGIGQASRNPVEGQFEVSVCMDLYGLRPTDEESAATAWEWAWRLQEFGGKRIVSTK